MLLPPSMLRKFLWFILLDSVVVYGVMIFLLEQFVLQNTDGGFVYEAGETVPMFLIWIFVAAGALALLGQYLLSQRREETLPREVFRYALLEFVGVLGFLIFLLGGHFEIPLAFIGVSAVGFILVFPRDKAV